MRRFIKPIVLLFLIIFFIFYSFFLFRSGKQSVYQELQLKTDSFSTETLWQLINDYRLKNKLPLLKTNELLCEFAQIRAKEIANDWSHRGFPMGYNRYCPRCYQIGENLVSDAYTPQEALDAWVSSPSHKANLDYPYNIGCLAINKDVFQIFVVLELGKL